MEISKQLSLEFKVEQKIIDTIISLIDEGNTIPFIARYRKEKTNAMDDQVLRELSERLEYLRSLETRRAEVAKAIENVGAMSESLSAALNSAVTLSEIEDIYRPFRPKRKTRASVAREKGLGQLAESILEQPLGSPELWAKNYVTEELSLADALQGASDIIAEIISDDAAVRKTLRTWLTRNAMLRVTAQDPQKQSVYSTYYDYKEPYSRVAPHRTLAINREEKEGFLSVSIEANEGAMQRILYNAYVKNSNEAGRFVASAADDSLDRLLFPSLEREMRTLLTDSAQENAIALFAANLKQLLLQPPVKGMVTLGLDPAYRTGCKIAVVDETGKVLDTTVVYPTPPQSRTEDAKRVLSQLIRKHKVRVIAIGNGTASRESEKFVCELIAELHSDLKYVMVSEAGASVYSASKLGAEEFPEFDVSLRSAVSIARRLQDPLAELVKIDPKSVGVGQYQHDMPAKRMDEALGGVVEACVNAVGVDLNTASVPLLSFVSGVNASVAKNIVTYREENGAFTARKELNKVPKLGKKAFEQCAGFLRIEGGTEILDNTGIHPESYKAAAALLNECGYTLEDVRNHRVDELPARAEEIGLAELSKRTGAGEMTLRDILAELLRPGRDLRDDLPKPVLRTDVLSMDDLTEGMELTGTVRNVVDFGAFIDIGVHEDGLVHISQFPTRIQHPSQAVKIGDVVTVWVLGMDKQKKRVSLTMRKM